MEHGNVATSCIVLQQAGMLIAQNGTLPARDLGWSATIKSANLVIHLGNFLVGLRKLQEHCKFFFSCQGLQSLIRKFQMCYLEFKILNVFIYCTTI